MSDMTAKELQAWLRAQFPKENKRHEWKEWHSLQHHVSGQQGDDVISYVSAIANMEGGALVLGVEDKTLKVTGLSDVHTYTPESLKFQLIQLCSDLPSEGLAVQEFVTTDTQAKVWIVQIPKHAPRRPVRAKGKAWQRHGDSLVELHEDRRRAILAEHLTGEDWSAVVVPLSTLADLDEAAIAKAREKYFEKHQREAWAAQIPQWGVEKLLDKIGLTIHGRITRACLLLLGRPEDASALLSPNPVEITWKVPAERVAEHFHPPFLLTTTEVAQHIRNPNIKLFPANELLAVTLPRYDTNTVLLEGLHNCLAHQDYAQCGRIVVEESAGLVRMINLGGFFDGRPEDYASGARTPERYRNDRLAKAMSEVGMIDKVGYGIYDMVQAQRRRFLPLPDYEGSSPLRTVFNVYGQQIDENYSTLLMERSDLPLEQVIWLDRVQKKQKVDALHIMQLRKAGLIEGRKPNYFVSAHVANATDTRTEYTRNKGLDDHYYKTLILQHIQKFKSVPPPEIRTLLLGKLPDSLTATQKQVKIKNLLATLRVTGLDGLKITTSGSGKGARWELVKH